MLLRPKDCCSKVSKKTLHNDAPLLHRKPLLPSMPLLLHCSRRGKKVSLFFVLLKKTLYNDAPPPTHAPVADSATGAVAAAAAEAEAAADAAATCD